jgi:predicted DNA-binding protein
MPKTDPKKRPFCVRIPPETVERLKAFVRDNAGKPLYLTVNAFVDEAIKRHIDHVQRQLDGDDERIRKRDLNLISNR